MPGIADVVKCVESPRPRLQMPSNRRPPHPAASFWRANVAGHHAVRDICAKLIERAVASPAIGNATNLLVHLASEIPWPADTIEAGALRIRITAIDGGRQAPLEAFEAKSRLDDLPPRQRPHRRRRSLIEADFLEKAEDSGFSMTAPAWIEREPTPIKIDVGLSGSKEIDVAIRRIAINRGDKAVVWSKGMSNTLS